MFLLTNIKSRLIYTVIPAVMALVPLFSSAQEITPGSAASKLWPVGVEKPIPARAGSKLFYDHPATIRELPPILQNLEFICGSKDKGLSVRPVTPGHVYIVTPVEGEPHSQEQALLGMGFVKLANSHFNLYEGQQEQIAVFHKINDRKFERITLSGWSVPFSSAEALPSFTEAARVITNPGGEYGLETRKWQGCPTIEQTGKRLWTGWFSGGNKEPDRGNYGIVSYSDDNGKTWKDPAIIIAHPDSNVRVMDMQIWKAPDGALWLLWVQNTGPRWFDGIWGTWGIRSENPDALTPTWSSPQRLADGLTRNKITVLSTGEWLLPSYNWVNNQSAIYVSRDAGKSWSLQGGPFNQSSYFFEHMTTELKNGRLWMLQRRMKESFSDDKGKTWTELKDVSQFTAPDSRLYLGRLRSGNLLLIYNDDPERKIRRNIVARLSEDDGKTWPHQLVLDERSLISYPDVVQNRKGIIYVVYDRSRTGEKEILLTTFTERDIKAGKYISKAAAQKRVISKAP